MIWFWLVITWVFLFFTIYMSYDHFSKGDLGLGFYWGFLALVFVILNFVVFGKLLTVDHIVKPITKE